MPKEQGNIAGLPNEENKDHEWCSICGDDNITLVVGGAVVLCSKHAAQMIHEIAELNLGLGDI